MSKLNRRAFLKNLTACAAGAAITKGFIPGGSSLAFAQSSCSSNRKVLVSIFLSGGPHGPSILVPRNTQAYFDKHPTLGIANSLPLDASHGLHPSMPLLHALYTQGKVVFMNGAGYPNHSRSHEDSTDLLGQGIISTGGNSTGWAGRFAKQYCASNETFSLFSFRGNITETQSPGITSPTASALANYGFTNDNQGTNHNRFVRQLLAESRSGGGVTNPHQQAMLDAWQTSDAAVQTIASVNTGYTGGPTYPNGLGQRLRDAAKLIISPLISARHIFISHGGFDTHGSQAASLPGLLSTLDLALNTFWSDMVARGRANDVVVAFYGEFGRTHENDTQGTDHGTGTFMGLLGNNLQGGVASPAYTENDFLNNNAPWVPVKFDYREVIEQIMIKHHGVDAAPILPEQFNRIGLNLFT